MSCLKFEPMQISAPNQTAVAMQIAAPDERMLVTQLAQSYPKDRVNVMADAVAHDPKKRSSMSDILKEITKQIKATNK